MERGAMGGAGSDGDHADQRGARLHRHARWPLALLRAAGAAHRRSASPPTRPMPLIAVERRSTTPASCSRSASLSASSPFPSAARSPACGRRKRALQGRDAATLEAERYRASESMLETILAAEPQVLLTWTAEDGPRVHVANLAAGARRAERPDRLLRFEEWLDAASAAELDRRHAGAGRSRRGLQPDAPDRAAEACRGRRPRRRRA